MLSVIVRIATTGGDVGDTDNGITAIGTETVKTVSIYGETVEISFTASGKWTPSLQYSTGADWAAITNTRVTLADR